MPRLPQIKRSGMLSKARACHFCKGRRWTGFWVRYGWCFRPSCSGCVRRVVFRGVTLTDEEIATKVQIRTT